MAIIIDGSWGEGGGQVVRSALTLSALTQRPFEMVNIRANRGTPGLARQHLTAVRATAEICDAEVDGNTLHSDRLAFHPGKVSAGSYSFRIGTAGSATLVAQTVLPALMTGDGPSEIVVEGGTHNPWAPPVDFLDRVWFPLLRLMGVELEGELIRHGFHPAGGGQFRATVNAVDSWQGLSITDSGKLLERRVLAVVANLPRHIAEREVETVIRRSGWPSANRQVLEVDSHGPGNVVMIEVRFEHLTELFTAFGQRGVPAEKVAAACWREAKAYLKRDAPVGQYLADQLLLPAALAAHCAGRASHYRTGPLSDHCLTQINLIGKFLDVVFEQDRVGDSVHVRVTRRE